MRLLLHPYGFDCISWNLRTGCRIVRAHKPAYGVIAQLDDLKDVSRIDRVKRTAFLTIETSPDDFQVWLAIEGEDDALVKRLMKGNVDQILA